MKDSLHIELDSDGGVDSSDRTHSCADSTTLYSIKRAL